MEVLDQEKQDDIDKIYLYAKDLSEHEILIKKCENAGIKYFNDPNVFIECSNTIDDVYENIDDYNPIRKKNFIVLTTWWQTWRIKSFMQK